MLPLRSVRILAAIFLLPPVLIEPLSADVVTRRDGVQIEGEVQSVDSEHVLVRTSSGRSRIPRHEVESIHFADTTPAPPLQVELRCLKADDRLEILLEGDVVVDSTREQGRWIDVTSRLKSGNNRLEFRIHNQRNTWAYHVSLRVNGVVTRLSCGDPFDVRKPCRCCGKQGWETGVIDDLPPAWLFVDRKAGTAEILP